MKLNMAQWIDNVRQVSEKKSLPVLSFPGIQLLRITVSELVASSELQAQCMKAIADRYDTAASVSLMDLSLEAEAFGARVRFSDTEVPTITGNLVETRQAADALSVPEAGAGRTGEAFKAIEKAVRLITDRPVLAGAIGPYSLAARLMGMTGIMVKCMKEPETVHLVLRKATAFLITYIKGLKEAGANGIVMAEPVAGLLSPGLCSEFSSRYVKQIIDAVEDENFIVVYHNCGNTVPLVDAIMSTGAKIIHLGNAVKLTDVIERYPKEKIIMGNIDPAGEFRSGTTASVARATRDLLEELGGYSNWIISSGCDIPPMTPLENLDIFFQTVHDFYKS